MTKRQNQVSNSPSKRRKIRLQQTHEQQSLEQSRRKAANAMKVKALRVYLTERGISVSKARLKADLVKLYVKHASGGDRKNSDSAKRIDFYNLSPEPENKNNRQQSDNGSERLHETDPPLTSASSSSSSSSSSKGRAAEHAKEEAQLMRPSATLDTLIGLFDSCPQEMREQFLTHCNLQTDPRRVKPPKDNNARKDLSTDELVAQFAEELAQSFGTTPSDSITRLCGEWLISAADPGLFPILTPEPADIYTLHDDTIRTAGLLGDLNVRLPAPKTQPPTTAAPSPSTSTAVAPQVEPSPHPRTVYLCDAYAAIHQFNNKQGEAQYRESVSSRIVNPAFERESAFMLTGSTLLPMPDKYKRTRFLPDTMVVSKELDVPIVLVEVKPDGDANFVVHHPDLEKMLVMMALSLSERMETWQCSREAQDNPLLSTIFGVLFAGKRCHFLSMSIKLQDSNPSKVDRYLLSRVQRFHLAHIADVIHLHLMLQSIAQQYSALSMPAFGPVDLQLTPGKVTSSRTSQRTQNDRSDASHNGGGRGKSAENKNKTGQQRKKASSGNEQQPNANQSNVNLKYSLTPVIGEPDIQRGTYTQIDGKRISVTAVTKEADSSKDSNGVPNEVALLQQLGQLPAEYSCLYPRLIDWEYVDAARSKYLLVLETGIPIRDFIHSNVRIGVDCMPQRLALLLPLFTDVAEALLCLHKQGYWHRDVKPCNVIVNTSRRSQLIDFNISKKQPAATKLHSASESESKSKSKSKSESDYGSPSPSPNNGQSPKVIPEKQLNRFVRPAGTTGYIAPELYTGAAFTAACDVYSLGICLLSLTLDISTTAFKDHNDTKKDAEREWLYAIKVRQGLLDRLHAQSRFSDPRLAMGPDATPLRSSSVSSSHSINNSSSSPTNSPPGTQAIGVQIPAAALEAPTGTTKVSDFCDAKQRHRASAALSASKAGVDHDPALSTTKILNVLELMVCETAAQRPSLESIVATLKSCAQP